MQPFDLRRARFRLRMTQVEMAAYLSTPLGTYQRWEQGRSRIPGIVEKMLNP